MRARTVFAPAKINLGLRITGRYANGYHRLESVFVPVSLYDRLTISGAVRDEVFYDWGDVAAGQKRYLSIGAQGNPLLWKSIAYARKLVEHSGGQIPPIRVCVQKSIPSPSGLGGASTDAATLIFTLLKTFSPASNLDLKADLLRQVSGLGADIPFFLYAGLRGRPAMLEGLGYELTAVDLPQLCGWICVPDFGFSTKAMFAEVRKMAYPQIPDSAISEPQLPSRILALRLNEIPYSDKLAEGVKVVQNDFYPIAAALFPSEHQALQLAMRILAETAKQFFPGQWLVGMTGSGAGIFAVTDARLARRALRERMGTMKARLGRAWQVFPVGTHPAENIIGP